MTPAEKLDYLYSSLKRLLDGDSPKSILGFQKSPQPEVIYIGECSGRPWYRMTDAGDAGRQAIEHSFLAGMLVELEVRQKRSTEYGDRMKLRVNLQCGDVSYALVSGLGTYFSRALVSGICNIPADFDFSRGPIGIEASTGEKGKVILPSLYVFSGGGWTKVKCDAAAMGSEEKMTEAIAGIMVRLEAGSNE